MLLQRTGADPGSVVASELDICTSSATPPVDGGGSRRGRALADRARSAQHDAEHEDQQRREDRGNESGRRERDDSEHEHHHPEPLRQHAGADDRDPRGPEEAGHAEQQRQEVVVPEAWIDSTAIGLTLLSAASAAANSSDRVDRDADAPPRPARRTRPATGTPLRRDRRSAPCGSRRRRRSAASLARAPIIAPISAVSLLSLYHWTTFTGPSSADFGSPPIDEAQNRDDHERDSGQSGAIQSLLVS